MSSSGWVGVDLDGTLAEYGGWKGAGHIGKPIELMLARVKLMLHDGIEVRIFTARCSDGDPMTVREIQEWCLEHIGVALKVTNVKDYSCVAIFDDRAIAVEKNTGKVLFFPGALP